MQMFVLFIFSSLIFKMISAEKQYNVQRGKLHKAFPKLKDYHKLYKSYKHTTSPTLHMIDNEDCEFPLENNVAEMLLDNQDAEISGESKGIKRFIQTGYGQFSSRTTDRKSGNYLLNTKVKDSEYKTMISNVIPNRNKSDTFDCLQFNNIQKRAFLLDESPLKNTIKHNDTGIVKYGKESLKESNIADIINNNIYNNDDRGQYYKNDLKSDYLEYRPNFESVSKKEFKKILNKDAESGIMAEDYISDDSISLFGTTNVGKQLFQIKPTLTSQQLPISTQPQVSNAIASSKIVLQGKRTSANWKSNQINENFNHSNITTHTYTEKGKCSINVPLKKITTENIHTNNQNLSSNKTHKNQGTPSNSVKTTKNKLRGLIERISNKTEILKKPSSTKSSILVLSHHHGQTKVLQSSPLPMLKKLFGKAVSKAPKLVRPITIHREGCLSPKPHKPFPIRHKGGDTGNHYYHGKRMKNTHEHAQPTTPMYAPDEKPSANVPVDERSNEPIISKKKKVNINRTTCNIEDSTCNECEINDIKDILPQPLPKKDLHL